MNDTPEIVERVARAIYESQYGLPWDGQGVESVRASFREDARAAMEAQRDLSDEIAEHVASDHYAWSQGAEETPACVRAVWETTLDAALGKPTKAMREAGHTTWVRDFQEGQ